MICVIRRGNHISNEKQLEIDRISNYNHLYDIPIRLVFEIEQLINSLKVQPNKQYKTGWVKSISQKGRRGKYINNKKLRKRLEGKL